MDRAVLEAKVREKAGKIYDKTIGKKVDKMTLPQQVRYLKQMMKLPFAPKAGVIRDLYEGLPEDIKRMAAEGKSKTEIKDYFWGCPEWQELWVKDLEQTEEQLDTLIQDSMLAFVQGQ